MVEKQAKFTKTVAKFIVKATELGYLLTLGEAWRSREVAEMYAKQGRGIVRSLHIDRLAIDLNAFKDGVYLDGKEEWHIPHLTELGEVWESLDPVASWGGRFRKKDYNHYSFMHNGVK